MCGIVALIGRGEAAAQLARVKRMMASIRHRGPDDDGVYQDGSVTFGFRRLSILDLSPLGHQPMTSPDGAYTIVFNGEIYNYLELRRELEGKGHVFRSQSDTEVLLHAYLEWGRECVHRCNGMWAFLIWDRGRKTLFGSRDRFGIKPLYTLIGDGYVVLASEIKAIRASGLYRDQINRKVIAAYLLDERIDDTPESFFEGIQQIPPGVSFEIGSDLRLREQRFFHLRAITEAPHASPARAFAELFEDAVKLHTRSDVPVGVHLSGGLDSTAILCASARDHAAQGSPEALKAFSFIDREFDESTYIHDTVRQTGAELFTLKTNAARVWADFPRMLEFQDEPVHSLTPVIGFQLMQLARAHGVPVVLNGQGADETIGGYSSYFRDTWVSLLERGRFGLAWREISEYASANDLRAGRLLLDLVRHFLQSQVRAYQAYRRAAKRRRLGQYRNLDWINPALVDAHSQLDAYDAPDLRSVLTRSIERDPLPLYLRVEDRNSMAHSVEARLPFLDYRLVELVFSLAPEWKLRGPLNKFVLREAMRERIPESVRARRDKMGFPTPAARWIANDLYPEFRRIFSDLCLANDEFFHRQSLLAHLERHRGGETRHTGMLFRAAQLLLWRETLKPRHEPLPAPQTLSA